VSVDAVQARLIWLQLAAAAVSPVGTEGAVRSRSVVELVDVDALVVVVVELVVLVDVFARSVVALATFE
jgi:hypothetical protein